MGHGTMEAANRARHSQHVAGTHPPIVTRAREVPDTRVDGRSPVGIDTVVESNRDLGEKGFHEELADETRAVRDAVGLAGGPARQKQAWGLDGSRREQNDPTSNPIVAVGATVDDAIDSSVLAH